MFLLIDVLTCTFSVCSDFNTSHVSINHRAYNKRSLQRLISIHLMFLLIGTAKTATFTGYDFNTSHVSINLCQGSKNGHGDEFQYISCFY